MPLELFIYFLLPGGAEESVWSVCGPPAGHQSRASLQCSSYGTPPRCQPCRQWGRRLHSILRSLHSLGRGALGISQGLRKMRGQQWDGGQEKKKTLTHMVSIWTYTRGYQTGKCRDESCIHVITIGRQTKQKSFCVSPFPQKKDTHPLFQACTGLNNQNRY